MKIGSSRIVFLGSGCSSCEGAWRDLWNADDNLLHQDGSHTGMFTLWKLIDWYIYNLCAFLAVYNTLIKSYLT